RLGFIGLAVAIDDSHFLAATPFDAAGHCSSRPNVHAEGELVPAGRFDFSGNRHGPVFDNLNGHLGITQDRPRVPVADFLLDLAHGVTDSVDRAGERHDDLAAGVDFGFAA